MNAQERKLARRQLTASNPGTLNRGQTAVIVAGLMIAAVASAVWADRSSEHQRRFDAQLDRYIQENQCVVADTQGKAVKTYRCDKPTPGRYVPARDVYQAVRDEPVAVKR